MNAWQAKIGFMQGRLSPLVNGRIQCFPADHWRAEYPQAQAAGFRLMEWTLDDEGLRENPFNTAAGQGEIRSLSERYGVRVKSVTCDHFMQAPFFKVAGTERASRMDRLKLVVDSAAKLEAEILVIPLVDQSTVLDDREEELLKAGMLEIEPRLRAGKIRIAFETDYVAEKVPGLLTGMDAPTFGINYDIGNSASLGYDPSVEWKTYGKRVIHVHVKDRIRGGTTVAVGTGSADFKTVFDEMKNAGYTGDFVLQTARASDGDHLGALVRYRDFTLGEITKRWTSH